MESKLELIWCMIFSGFFSALSLYVTIWSIINSKLGNIFFSILLFMGTSIAFYEFLSDFRGKLYEEKIEKRKNILVEYKKKENRKKRVEFASEDFMKKNKK